MGEPLKTSFTYEQAISLVAEYYKLSCKVDEVIMDRNVYFASMVFVADLFGVTTCKVAGDAQKVIQDSTLKN